MFDGDMDWEAQEELLYLYYFSISCNTCGQCVDESDLPYVNGMFDYSCLNENCGGYYE